MGMTIEHVNKLLSIITVTITEDDDCFTIEDENLQVFKEALLIAIDTMRKYQQLQADYENRLKADMVAILEDLDLLIDEFDPGCGWDGYIKKIDVHEIIQEKIDALKGE